MKQKRIAAVREGIRWFKKFSLLERLKIAFDQQRAIRLLRGLRIEGIDRPA